MDCLTSSLLTVETVLRRDHFVSLGLKGGDQFTEARTIRPESVSEYNTWFGCHIFIFLLLGIYVEHSLGSS